MSSITITRRRDFRALQGLSDEDLMEMLQNGNDVAFTILVRRYYRRIRHYLFGFTRNREQSEDLTQETFLRVYRSRQSYRRIAKFSTWLYTIAGNLARSEFRRRKRRRFYSVGLSVDVGEQPYVVPDTQAAPDEKADTSLRTGLVHQALREIPESFRELLVLRDIQELTYEEIGAITGLPMGTVKSRLHRGRRKIHKLVAEAAD